MKKIIAMLLAVLMVLSLGATAFAAEGDDITLDVIICQYGPSTENWFLGDGMDGTNFVAKFEEANPGIKLNLEVISWDDVDRVVDTRISSGQAPDVLNNDNFANYAYDDLLEPVSQYCPDDLFEDFFPSFIAESVIDDVVYAVPDLASARALYYNVDMFDEMGIEPPATWQELEDVCQTIIDFYDGEIYPWGIDMTSDEGQAAFAYYTWGNEGGFVDEDNNWIVNCDENVEAIEFAISLVDNGYTNPNPATQTRYDLQDLFAAGKLAMCIAPNSMPTYCAEKESEVNMSTAPIPCNEGKAAASAGVMDRVMAFKDESLSEEETAARDEAIGAFLKFFYDPENYVGWVSMEGFLPAVNSAVGALVEEDASFGAWLEVLDSCRFYPTALENYDLVREGVVRAEQAALTGADVRAELDAVQALVVPEE